MSEAEINAQISKCKQRLKKGWHVEHIFIEFDDLTRKKLPDDKDVLCSFWHIQKHTMEGTVHEFFQTQSTQVKVEKNIV